MEITPSQKLRPAYRKVTSKLSESYTQQKIYIQVICKNYIIQQKCYIPDSIENYIQQKVTSSKK
jgi:hypothetical protein